MRRGGRRTRRLLRGTVVLLALAGLLSAGTAQAEIAPWTLYDDEPMGSRQYALGVIEIGATTGYIAGGHLGYGVHYAERGSMLAQMLFGAGSAAGAGAEAVRTGKSQTYYMDRSLRSMAAIELDVLGATGGASAFNLDLFYMIPGGDNRLPWVWELGLNVHSQNSPEIVADMKKEAANDPDLKKRTQNADGQSGVGLFVGLILPLTPRVQLEGAARLQYGYQFWSAEFGAVGNVSDRIFVRWRNNYTGSLASFVTAGVRL